MVSSAVNPVPTHGQRPGHGDRTDYKVVMTSHVFGPKVSPIDIIGTLIRNPDETFNADIKAYDRILTNPVVLAEFTDLCAPIVDAESSVTGVGILDDTLTEIVNNIPMLAELKEQLLFAYITGIRMVELVWGVVKIGDFEFAAPTAFLPHDHMRFAFDFTGNLWMTQDSFIGTNSRWNNLVLTQTKGALYVPNGKIIYHRYRDGDGRNGYGHGEGKNLYRLVKAWDAAFSFWADYNQDYGVPLKWLKLDPEFVRERVANGTAVDDVAQEEFEKLSAAIGGDTYVSDGRNELIIMYPTAAPPETFERMLHFVSDMIRLTITGETVTSSGNEKGSFALARVAREKPIGRRGRLSRHLERTLTEQLLRPLIRFNGAKFPPQAEAAMMKVRTPQVSPMERLEIIRTSPFPVVHQEFYDLAEITAPSDMQIAMGQASTPKSAAGDLSAGSGSPFGM